MAPAKTKVNGQTEPKNYAALRIEFADWLMSSPRIGTQQDWSTEHRLNEATVSQWKRHPEVLARQETWRDSQLAPARSDVIEAMIRRARAGNVQAARLLGEWGGWEMPKKLEHSGSVDGAIQVVPAQWPDYDVSGKIVPIRRSA